MQQPYQTHHLFAHLSLREPAQSHHQHILQSYSFHHQVKRSAMNIMNSIDPIPDPCTIDLLIIQMIKDLPPNLVNWSRSDRKEMTH